MYTVFDLASTDTRLHRVTVGEYAGPCPGCRGTDRFHVNLTKRDGRGGWMCRSCWPAEEKGWGDAVDYLMHFRGMRYPAARASLGEQVTSLLSSVESRREALAGYKSTSWQDMVSELARSASHRLWTPEGAAALDYLYGRKLTEKTSGPDRLGYDVRWNPTISRNVPCITIPWYADKKYWKLNCRDIRPEARQKERYFHLAGSTNEGLYLGDILLARRDGITFLVEDEFSALTIAQEAGDLVNVVALAGADSKCSTLWTMRLAAQSAVLLALDDDETGEDSAQAWRRILRKSKRYRPLFCKDANEMLQRGRSVRSWVEAAIEYTVPALLAATTRNGTAAARVAVAEPEVEPDDIILPTACSVCGNTELYQFSEDGSRVWCLSCWKRLQAHIALRLAPGSPLALKAVAADLLEPVFGPCQVTIERAGYTLAQHIKALEFERVRQAQSKQRRKRKPGT